MLRQLRQKENHDFIGSLVSAETCSVETLPVANANAGKAIAQMPVVRPKKLPLGCR